MVYLALAGAACCIWLGVLLCGHGCRHNIHLRLADTGLFVIQVLSQAHWERWGGYKDGKLDFSFPTLCTVRGGELLRVLFSLSFCLFCLEFSLLLWWFGPDVSVERMGSEEKQKIGARWVSIRPIDLWDCEIHVTTGREKGAHSLVLKWEKWGFAGPDFCTPSRVVGDCW